MPRYADTSGYTDIEIDFWNWLCDNQQRSFLTKRGLEFQIAVKGNELFVSRKQKSLSRATINVALKKAQEIGRIQKTPKELGPFGASYLMPLFVRYGILKTNRSIESDLFPV